MKRFFVANGKLVKQDNEPAFVSNDTDKKEAKKNAVIKQDSETASVSNATDKKEAKKNAVIERLQRDLKALHLCKLRRVAFRKQGRRTTLEAEQAWEAKKWDGPVILHFRGREWIRFPKNWHRTGAVCFSVLAATFMFSTSNLCWECVDRINMRENLTTLELQQVFQLAGACGRQAPIGAGSRI